MFPARPIFRLPRPACARRHHRCPIPMKPNHPRLAATRQIPAATVVIFRKAPDGGPPELLMVQRAQEMRFAGGAAVFPGGRIDPADRELAASSARRRVRLGSRSRRGPHCRHSRDAGGNRPGDRARAAGDRRRSRAMRAPCCSNRVSSRRCWSASAGGCEPRSAGALRPLVPARATARSIRASSWPTWVPGAVDITVDADREHPAVLGKRAEALRLADAGEFDGDLPDPAQPGTAGPVRQLRRCLQRCGAPPDRADLGRPRSSATARSG